MGLVQSIEWKLLIVWSLLKCHGSNASSRILPARFKRQSLVRVPGPCASGLFKVRVKRQAAITNSLLMVVKRQACGKGEQSIRLCCFMLGRCLLQLLASGSSASPYARAPEWK